MKKIFEVGLYLLFGGLTTLVNFLVYTLVVGILGVTLSNAVAWIVAVLFAFVANRKWVFQSRSKQWFKEFLPFVGGRTFSGLLEIFLPTLLITLGLNQTFFDIPGFWAKAAVTVLVVVLNYIISKFLVFQNRS
ncbi:MAG: GtrA family protein [Clostridia bacterium]|nr:GtrA family protein [Clostridia bacterium]